MPGPAAHRALDLSAPPRRFCRGCGYSLFGLCHPRCPECGKDFDLANPRSFARRPPRRALWRWGRRVAAPLLLSILLAGAGVEWLRRGWQSEQNAIASLRAVHGTFTLKPIGPDWLGRLLPARWSHLRDRVQVIQLQSLQPEQIDDLDLKSLRYVEFFRSSFCALNARNLDDMGHWKNLHDLTIKCARFEGPTLAHLKRFPGLTRLSLRGMGFAEGSLAPLASLPQLRTLDLSATHTCDRDLPVLRGLPVLEELDLSMSRVTDRGLQQLNQLQSLRVLKLDKEQATRASIDQLKKALPQLRVVQ